MMIDFTKDKIELTADDEGTIFISAKGRKRKIRLALKQLGQIFRDGHVVLMRLHTKTFAKTHSLSLRSRR